MSHSSHNWAEAGFLLFAASAFASGFLPSRSAAIQQRYPKAFWPAQVLRAAISLGMLYEAFSLIFLQP